MGEEDAAPSATGATCAPSLETSSTAPQVIRLLKDLEAGRDVLPDELSDALAAAARLAQRAADTALYQRLALEGFAGQEYDIFRGELAAYAFPVLKAWVRTGRIFACCAQRGRPVSCSEPLRRHLGADEADRTELAAETAAIALNTFHENVLVPGIWDGSAGASLKTFFVGACLNAFPNVFRRWLTEFRKWAEVCTYGTVEDLDGIGRELLVPISLTDPAEIVIGEHTVYDALATARPAAREAAARRIFLDEKFAEIAKHLKVTERAVKGLLYRVRTDNLRPRRKGPVL